MKMNISVIGVQGAVSEHIEATKKAMEKLGFNGEVRWVKDRHALESSDAAIIPGGESTTISRLIEKGGLLPALETMPIFGTCAGMVLLASEGDSQVKQTGQTLLKRMDFQVDRNAFGRQRESFQAGIQIFGKPFEAVFIRAPAARKVFGKAKAVATYDGRIVAVEQGNCLALSFHPELTGDTRLHEHFLKGVKR